MPRLLVRTFWKEKSLAESSRSPALSVPIASTKSKCRPLHGHHFSLWRGSFQATVQRRTPAEQTPRNFPHFRLGKLNLFTFELWGRRACFRRYVSIDWDFLVLPVRIELTTSPLPRECSTTELRQRPVGQGRAEGTANRWTKNIEKTRRCLPQGAFARKEFAAPAGAVTGNERSGGQSDQARQSRKMGGAERAACCLAARKPEAAQGPGARPGGHAGGGRGCAAGRGRRGNAGT